jgi:hypothetical protein
MRQKIGNYQLNLDLFHLKYLTTRLKNLGLLVSFEKHEFIWKDKISTFDFLLSVIPMQNLRNRFLCKQTLLSSQVVISFTRKQVHFFRFGIKLEEISFKWARAETAAGTVAGRAAGATGATEAAARVEHRVRQVEATAEVRVEQMRNWPENWMTPVSD